MANGQNDQLVGPVIFETPSPLLVPQEDEQPAVAPGFSNRITGDGGIGDILKPIISDLSNDYAGDSKQKWFTGDVKLDETTYNDKITALIDQYNSAYEDTNFEFTPYTSYDPNSNAQFKQIKVVGENGNEKLFDFKNGNQIPEINNFIEETKSEENRNKSKSTQASLESFLNRNLNFDSGNWRRSGEEAYDPLGPDFLRETFQDKGYLGLNDYIEREGPEGLRKELRKQFNELLRFNNPLESRTDFLSFDDSTNAMGISDYKFDQIFDQILNEQLTKEELSKQDFNRKLLQQEINEQNPSDNFLFKIEGDDIDYRDLPEYAQISESYFKTAVSSLNSKEREIGGVNEKILQLSYDYANMVDSGDLLGANILKSEIEALQNKSISLLNDYMEGNTKLFFNFAEGSVRFDQPTPNANQDDNISVEYNKYIDEFTILKNEDFQALQERFNMNSMNFDNLDKILKQTYDIEGAFTIQGAGGSWSRLGDRLRQAGYEYDPETGIYKDIPMSFLVENNDVIGKEQINVPSDKGDIVKPDLKGLAVNLREQIKTNAIERKALTTMYVLNTDPGSLKRTSGVASFAESMIETFTGDLRTIQSKSDRLADIEKIGNSIGVPWSENQQRNFQETRGEFVGKTLGAVPQIAAEFGILNAVTGGISTATGLSSALMTMRVGRLYKNGRQISHAYARQRALSKGYSLNKQGIEAFYKADGITVRGASVIDKAQALGITMLIEEGKMQLMGLPTGSGASFAFTGSVLNSVTKRLGFYFTGGLANLNSGLKFARGGITFGISAEAALNVEAAIDDLIGGKDFQTFIDENYRELSGDEITKRQLGHILTGLGFAIGHSRTLQTGIKGIRYGLKGDGFAFTINQKKKLRDKVEKIIDNELKKPENQRDIAKIEKYNDLIAEIKRQLDVAEGYYRYYTPEILKKRVERDLLRNKKQAVKDYGDFYEIKVQIGGKGLNGSGAQIKMINGKKTLVVDALNHRNKGIVPHEMAHFYTEKEGFTEEEFERLYDIIELQVDAATKTYYTKKGYKSFKEFIETEYKKVNEKTALGSEKIANIIEFISNKDIMKNIVENNAFFRFEQGIKSFYERRLQGKGIFKNKEIGFQDAQDVMAALYRIANATGKRGVARQWRQLRGLVQFNGELIDAKTQLTVGKTSKKSSLELSVENFRERQTEQRENEQIYQRVDRLINEAIKNGTWERNKRDVSFQLAYEFEGNIIGRLNRLQRLGKLEGFTKDDISLIAGEYVTAEKNGLRSAIEAFKPERMIDRNTGKPSLATYLESSTAQGKLIDVKLRKFYQESPKFGRIIKTITEDKVKRQVEARLIEQPSLDIVEIKEGAKINPLELKSIENKSERQSFETAIRENFNKFTDQQVGELSFNKLKDLAPEVTAKFFGIPKSKITDATKNLTYSQKIKDGVRVASEAGNVQNVINRNALELLALLPKTNVVPETSINKVDVSRNIVGTSLGLPSSLLKVFYNKTGERSKGLTSQTNIFEIKKDLSIKDFKEAFGITIGGELNTYNRQIGQRLKSMASLTGKLITNKAVRNILAGRDVNTIINDIAAGKSDKMSSLQLSELNREIRSILIPTAELVKQKLRENSDIFKIKSQKEIFDIVDKVFKDKTLEKDISGTEQIARIFENANAKRLAEQSGLEVADITFYEKSTLKRYKARYDREGISDQYKTVEQRDNPVDLARKRNFETKILNKFAKDVPLRVLDAFVDTFGTNTRSWKRDGKYVNKGREGSQKFLEKEYPGYTGSGKKYDGKYDAVYWPTNWGEKGSGVKKPFLDLIKKLDRQNASEAEKNTQLTELFNKVMTNPNGKYTYEQTARANRIFLNDYLNATREAYKETSKQTKEVDARVDMYRHYQMQTNIARGILKGAVPVTSISTRAEGKKGLHWEHNMQLNNFSDFFFDINAAGGKKSDISILVNNASQALIPYSLKQKNDSAESGGTTGYGKFYGKDGMATLSSNPEMNFITNPNVAGNQIRTTGQSAGLRLAEQIVNTVKKEVLIKRLNEMNDSADKFIIQRVLDNKASVDKVKNNNARSLQAITGKSSLNLSSQEIVDKLRNIDKAIELARIINKPKKGISVLDFDDTVAKSKSKVGYTLPNGTKGKLSATEFARTSESLEARGAKFDFSEFNRVIDGKKGPLFDKLEKAVNKFGNQNVFILTARPQQAAIPIQRFLSNLGVKLKLKNIVGLGDGKPSAKAQFMVDKAAEGFNDFYFADDAIKNVKAVKRVLDIIDVKSNVQLAKSSLNLSENFNEIIEYSTGIGKDKTYSTAKARLQGKGGSGTGWYVPSTAEDFAGLMRPLYGRGKKGIQNEKWFKDNLFRPYSRGEKAVAADRMVRMQDYKAIKNQLKESGVNYKNVFKKHPLKERINENEPFTNSHAVRVYLWSKQNTLPGDLSKADINKLVRHVNSNPKLKAFADQIFSLGKGDGYPAPRANWLTGNITTDMLTGFRSTKRSKYMKEFNDNADVIFSEANLNKLEANFGRNYRESLENMLYRMKNGTNRSPNLTRAENGFLDWVNGSVGATMFLNTRSALLQTISSTNYVNFSDNNPFKAAKAFANQKQFWKDYIELMNSEWATNRRNGLRLNVSEAEIIEAAANSTNKAAAIINSILSKGFIFTKYADTHATAFGGATFYRNRINTYKKQGLSENVAKERARKEWEELSEENQQSARADKISQEQASILGRFTLNYNNVVMQYARNMKKEVLDLANGRYEGTFKGNNSIVAKVGRILYYGAVQNIIFQTLQNAVFMQFFDEGLELDDNTSRAVNGLADALLKGSGIYGAGLSTVKNVLFKVYQEAEKDRPEYVEAAWQLLTFSPPVDKKVRQFRNTLRAYQYDLDEMKEKGFSLDNPAYLANANLIEASTNVPVARLVKKLDNIRGAMDQDRTAWQKVFLLAGYPAYQLGIEDDDGSYNPKTYRFKSGTSKFSKKKF